MTNPLQWPWIWMRLLLYSTSTQTASERKTWMAFSQVMDCYCHSSSSSWSKPESSTFQVLWPNVGHFPRDSGGSWGVTDYNKNNGLEILFRLISLPEYYLLGKLFKKKKKKSLACVNVQCNKPLSRVQKRAGSSCNHFLYWNRELSTVFTARWKKWRFHHLHWAVGVTAKYSMRQHILTVLLARPFI